MSWGPHSFCSRLSRFLHGWFIDTHKSMPFSVPMIWREQKDHLTDCYFCLTKVDGHNSKYKHIIVYPSIPSALRHVEHDSLPITKPLQQGNLLADEPTSTSPEDEPGPSCSYVYPDFPERTVPHLISQYELNDLVRDLNLSKIQGKILASRLKRWDVLQLDVKLSYRIGQESLSPFCTKDG